jgi:hypothetical protein
MTLSTWNAHTAPIELLAQILDYFIDLTIVCDQGRLVGWISYQVYNW